MKHTRIPTILGIIILVLGVGVGVAATQYRTIFKTSASPDSLPQDVRITNVSDSSFTVSWVTDKETIGSVLWGTTQGLGQTAVDEDTQLKNTHFITLRELQANTSYYFKISSGGQEYDNSGIPWQTQTTNTSTLSGSTDILSGSVLTQSGQPAQGVLVYITSEGLSPLSAYTSQSGSWVLPLEKNIVDNAQILQIFAQAGPSGVSTAQIRKGSANPTPTMTLGQTYDFKSNDYNDGENVPEATIDVAPPTEEEIEEVSGFDLSDSTPASSVKTVVTLESIDEGEIITTTDPEFFGEAPSGLNLNITVESDPISASVKVPSSGNWSWSPPKDLEPGTHKITLSWTDTNGILRKLVRTFEVSAQEGPAFESTPSGSTPTPTASPTTRPTASPSPTVAPSASSSATPKATLSPTPSASPRVSIPSTDSGTPIAGNLTPTLLLSIMGIGLLVISISIAIKASI